MAQVLGKCPWERGGRPVLLGATPGAPPPRPGPRTSGKPGREEKGRTKRPAPLRDCAPVCSRAPRACTPRAPARPACLRPPRARTLRAPSQIARLRTRRAPARLTGTSCGVHPAPSGATRRVRGTRPVSSNHNPSPLSSAAGKVCDLVFNLLS